MTNSQYKAGDKIALWGDRKNGKENRWILTIAQTWDMDGTVDSFQPFTSTTGHLFEGDVLTSPKGCLVGRHFVNALVL